MKKKARRSTPLWKKIVIDEREGDSGGSRNDRSNINCDGSGSINSDDILSILESFKSVYKKQIDEFINFWDGQCSCNKAKEYLREVHTLQKAWRISIVTTAERPTGRSVECITRGAQCACKSRPWRTRLETRLGRLQSRTHVSCFRGLQLAWPANTWLVEW